MKSDEFQKQNADFLVFKQVIGTTLVLQLCSCDCSNDWELKLLMMERAFSRGL